MMLRLKTRGRFYAALLMSSVALACAASAGAQINGFNNGVGYTANSDGALPTFFGNSVTLTDGGGNEHRSIYSNTKQSITQFTSQFTYQAQPGSGLADGATFILQNVGLNALSTNNGGSGLGMNGLSPSAEVEFNVFNGHTVGTNFETNGANSGNYIDTSPVNLDSSDPIRVNLSYNGTTLTEKLTDLTTHSKFSTSYTTDLSSVLGGNTAFVGFTAATGGATSTQTISNFRFTSSVPESGGLITLTMLGMGGASLLLRRVRARR